MINAAEYNGENTTAQLYTIYSFGGRQSGLGRI